MSFRVLLSLLAVLVMAVSCGQSAPTPDVQSIVESAVASAMATPTPTSPAADTATPASTPDVEAIVAAAIEASRPTPAPTPTPTPTATPTPEPTPLPPTPVPTPDMEALVSAAAVAVAAALPTPTPTPRPTPTPTPRPTPTPTPSLAEMVAEVRPAVVRIDNTATGGGGSGVIVDTSGSAAYVVTNWHVVEGAGQVAVTVNDTESYTGQILGSSAAQDLAVVQICCGTFTVADFGDAWGLQSGTEVMAVGYALGIPGAATVTRGIVSAVRYDDTYRAWVIQTDAPINPGNSGGGLFSQRGELLGINTFKATDVAIEGLGFAISASTVEPMLPRLKVSTPVPTPVPTPRHTPRPTPAPTSAWTSNFGPVDGELWHQEDDFIKDRYANLSLANVLVEATFVNPYDASFHEWSYGFMLRHPRRWDIPSIHLVVLSDKRWGLIVGAEPPREWVAQGRIDLLNIRSGGRNHLMVLAMGEKGLFFVNSNFVAELDLSGVTDEGDVAVMTGPINGTEVDGEVTKYEGFKVDKLTKEYGPVGGTIEDNKEGYVGVHGSGVWARNLVMEATFTNPNGLKWDYGFTFHHPYSNRLDIIAVTRFGRWVHKTRADGDSEYTTLNQGTIPDSRMWPVYPHRLLLIALDDVGWLLSNGEFVARLDLSKNQDAGGASVLGGFFEDSEGPVRFEDFSVWIP